MSKRTEKLQSKYDSNTIQMMELFQENVKKDIVHTNELIESVRTRLDDYDTKLASLRQLANQLNLDFTSMKSKCIKLDTSFKRAHSYLSIDSLSIKTNLPMSSSSSSPRSSLVRSSSTTFSPNDCLLECSMLDYNTNKLSPIDKHHRHDADDANENDEDSKSLFNDSGKCNSSSCSSSTKSNKREQQQLERHLTKSSTSIDLREYAIVKHCPDHDYDVDSDYGDSFTASSSPPMPMSIDSDDTFNDIDVTYSNEIDVPVYDADNDGIAYDDVDYDGDNDDDDYDDDDEDTSINQIEFDKRLFHIRNSYDDKLLNENCTELIQMLLRKTVASVI